MIRRVRPREAAGGRDTRAIALWVMPRGPVIGESVVRMVAVAAVLVSTCLVAGCTSGSGAAT
ncbi:MAG TPA: hypothetical protein VID75_03700, partial [Acidimicrobiales bacterium]